MRAELWEISYEDSPVPWPVEGQPCAAKALTIAVVVAVILSSLVPPLLSAVFG